MRDPIDVLRAGLLVGAAAMALAGDPPRTIDLAFTLGMLLQGWGNALELFELWSSYNKIVHSMLPFGGSAVLCVLLARLEVVHDLHHRCTERQTLGVVVMTLALGFAAGRFYEVWEWFIHHHLRAPIYITYDDTITDMIDGHEPAHTPTARPA